MKPLDKIRKEINAIDSEMRELFEKRMDCAGEVIAYKLEHGLPIFDPAREKEIIGEGGAHIRNKAYREYYETFLTGLMDLSKKHQYRLSNQDVTGYQGTMGAFSHIASRKLFPQSRLESHATFEEVFIALDRGDIAFGVLPFENSYTGEIAEVLDLLMKYDCHIVQMYNQQVSHNLMGIKGADIKNIKEVFSHPQAISQCQTYLKGLDIRSIPYANTALAAEYVSKSGDKSKAAIASRETAELYGLEILAENINTSAENTTKFIVISKRPSEKGERFSLLFTVKHDAGQLAKIIEIIARHKFNMENIRSRPLKDVPWQYYFYVEIEGSLADERAKHLLKDMEKSCKGLKVLGCYEIA